MCKAIINTARNRESLNYLNNSDKYLELIRDDLRLKFLWDNYQKNYEYAQNISFEDTIAAIRQINEVLMLFSVGV